jgi:dGTPase
VTSLAPYASSPAQSRGRRYSEAPAWDRDDFQRDRDRIVHSSAFRRLVYKTQVFLNHEGDLFRTRLTHSLEVAQLARSMARQLKLNEDLTEAIALAHDLGHTPFGHAGQAALNDCMSQHGGFEHNLQSLRVVDHLERRYPGFEGLNLCFETREGILKHCSAAHARELEAKEPDGVAARFLRREQPSMEAQLCNLADEVAYSAHDIDDGVRSGQLKVSQLREQALMAELLEEARAEGADPSDGTRVWLYTALRRLMRRCATDLVSATQERLLAYAPGNVEAVRLGPPLVGFSPNLRSSLTELKRFLFQHLYRTPAVQAQMDKARSVLVDLFHHHLAHGLPQGARLADTPERSVADYLAGMTDRFALKEHERITGHRLFDTGA